MKRDHTDPVPRPEPLRLAAAIVILHGRVLLVRRSGKEGFLPRVWGVPCGKLDDGEDPGKAVLRELREETGLAGTVIRYVGRQSFESTWNGHAVENIQSNFLVRPRGVRAGEFPAVSPPEDDQAFRWVPTDQIGNCGLDDHNLATIRQGLQDQRVIAASAPSSSRR